MSSFFVTPSQSARSVLATLDFHSLRDKRCRTTKHPGADESLTCSVHVPLTEEAARAVLRCFSTNPPTPELLPSAVFQLVESGTVQFVPDSGLPSRVFPSAPPPPPPPPPFPPPFPPFPPTIESLPSPGTPVSSRTSSPYACSHCSPSSALPSPFTFVDLFSGIGGFALALRRLNGTCVHSCELNPSARATYLKNFGSLVPHSSDVQHLSPSSLPPSFDILTGGFPCQPFSVLGSMGAFADSRGLLFLEVVRLLTSCRPPAVLLENVPALANLEGGKVLRTIVASLEKPGYRVFVKVYDAANLLAQRRRRLFFVGIRADLSAAVRSFKFPERVPDLGTYVEDIVEPAEDLSADLALSAELHAKVAASSFARRYPAKKYVGPVRQKAATVISSYAKGTHFCQYYLSSFEEGLAAPPPAPLPVPPPRLFSPREVARLQGFPESFVLDVSPSASPYKLLGNAVPPALVALVAGNLLCALMHSGEMATTERVEKHVSLGERIAIDMCRECLPERSRGAFDERARRAIEGIQRMRTSEAEEEEEEEEEEAEQEIEETGTTSLVPSPAAFLLASVPLSQIFADPPALAKIRAFTHDSAPASATVRMDVLATILSYDSLLSAHRCTLVVQGSLIGAIFGIAGAVLNSIRTATGSTIFVDKKGSAKSEDEEETRVEIFQEADLLLCDWRTVYITSHDERAVREACASIIATLYAAFTADELHYNIGRNSSCIRKA